MRKAHRKYIQSDLADHMVRQLYILRWALFLIGGPLAIFWLVELWECGARGWLSINATPNAGRALWLYMVVTAVCLGILGSVPVLGGAIRLWFGRSILLYESGNTIRATLRLGMPLRCAYAAPLIVLGMFSLFAGGLLFSADTRFRGWITTTLPFVSSCPPIVGGLLAAFLFAVPVSLRTPIWSCCIEIDKSTSMATVRIRQWWKTKTSKFGPFATIGIVGTTEQIVATVGTREPAEWLVFETADGRTVIPFATTDLGFSPCFSEKGLLLMLDSCRPVQELLTRGNA